MFVAGTAGHVDHGKSTLIQALTGIDPDRLRVEKTRGMTIELGFAWLELPNCSEISIIDVPGHERFVKNMLMGAGGFDLALIVVAADEGVMPQTKEHIAILDLLEVQHAIAVITKADIGDPELIDLVRLEIDEELKDSALQGTDTIAVSAKTGIGISALKRLIAHKITELSPKRDNRRPRLFIDRSFAMPGFGAVVTGNLTGGSLKTGDNIQILPSGLNARIRGLQSHKEPLQVAPPGTRVAVSMTGISHSEINRGDALVKPRQHAISSVFDATIRSIDNAPRPIKHNHRLTAYSGTWEEPATVRILQGNRVEAGQNGYAQIKLRAAKPMLPRDKFVLRDSNDTLGGGTVLSINAPRHRRNNPQLIKRLQLLSTGSEQQILIQTISANPLSNRSKIAEIANLDHDAVPHHLQNLIDKKRIVNLDTSSAIGIYTTHEHWKQMGEDAQSQLEQYHQRYPLRIGMPRQELRNRLHIASPIFDRAVTRMEDENILTQAVAAIRLPQHHVIFTVEQQREVDRYLAVLQQHRYSPPAWNSIEPEILAALVAERKVVTAGKDVAFIAEAYYEMRDQIIELGTRTGSISISDVRKLLGTSRKYSLALLEQLDRENITMRNGDIRTIR